MRTAKKPIQVKRTGHARIARPTQGGCKDNRASQRRHGERDQTQNRNAGDDDGPLRLERTKQFEHLRGEREKDQPHEAHDGTAEPESQPAAARRLLGPIGAEVLPDQRHCRRAEGRTGQITQRLPADGDAVRTACFHAQAIDQAQKPKLSGHQRQAVKPGRHANAQQAPNQIEPGPKQTRLQLQPEAATSQHEQHRQSAQRVAQGGSHGNARKTQLREAGPSPKQSPQASGRLTMATPIMTYSPVRVSPAPIKQEMPANSSI